MAGKLRVEEKVHVVFSLGRHRAEYGLVVDEFNHKLTKQEILSYTSF